MKTEIVKFDTPELLAIEKSKAKQIKETFEPMVKMLEDFEESFNVVLEESKGGITKELTSKAKRLRLDVGRVRIETGKLKDKQKEYIKLEDKAIMGIHNIIVWAVTEKEDKLKEIENFFETQEKIRLDNLQKERVDLLTPYLEDAHERRLSEMEDDVWDAYLSAKKKEYEDRIEAEKQAELNRIEAEKKAEEERIAREKLEAEAREKQRIENEKLKAEAEKREKEIEAERKKQADILAKQKAESERLAKIEADKQAKIKAEQDAILKKEREAKAKLEAELKAKKDAEIKADNERKLADEKAKLEAEKLAKAPIKNQLNVWIDSMVVEIPESLKENEKANEILKKFFSFKNWAKNEIELI